MSIRQATAADCRNLAKIHVEASQAAYRGILSDHALSTLPVKAFETVWRQNLANPNRTDIVLEKDGNIVGFASYGPLRDKDMDRENICELYGIYLVEECWGAGFGRILLEHALNDLVGRGFRESVVWVLKDNEHARKFLERNGFEVEGATRTFASSIRSHLEEIRYRREIEPFVPPGEPGASTPT